MKIPGPLGEAMASIGNTTVSDETISLEVANGSGLPEDPTELRFLAYAGLYDLIAGASLEAVGSDDERAQLLARALSVLESVEPVVRFARYEHGSSIEALERASRMRDKDINATEQWLIPRLEGDIAAYRARIDALRRSHGEGDR